MLEEWVRRTSEQTVSWAFEELFGGMRAVQVKLGREHHLMVAEGENNSSYSPPLVVRQTQTGETNSRYAYSPLPVCKRKTNTNTKRWVRQTAVIPLLWFATVRPATFGRVVQTTTSQIPPVALDFSMEVPNHRLEWKRRVVDKSKIEWGKGECMYSGHWPGEGCCDKHQLGPADLSSLNISWKVTRMVLKAVLYNWYHCSTPPLALQTRADAYKPGGRNITRLSYPENTTWAEN